MPFYRHLIPVLLFCLCLASPLHAAEPETGAQLFQELNCVQCHHPDKKINGPALKTIAGVYGSRDKLLLFIKGTSESIVEPERARTMKPRRRILKDLNDGDQQAIADYIMSFKE